MKIPAWLGYVRARKEFTVKLLSTFFFLYLLFMRATPTAYGSSQARGRIRAAAAAHITATETQIWAESVTYTTAQGNAGSLTCWARPGIEPAYSWILVRFFSAEPRGELCGWNIFTEFDRGWVWQHCESQNSSSWSKGLSVDGNQYNLRLGYIRRLILWTLMTQTLPVWQAETEVSDLSRTLREHFSGRHYFPGL